MMRIEKRFLVIPLAVFIFISMVIPSLSAEIIITQPTNNSRCCEGINCTDFSIAGSVSNLEDGQTLYRAVSGCNEEKWWNFWNITDEDGEWITYTGVGGCQYGAEQFEIWIFISNNTKEEIEAKGVQCGNLTYFENRSVLAQFAILNKTIFCWRQCKDVSITNPENNKITYENVNATYDLTVKNTGDIKGTFILWVDNLDNAKVALNTYQVELNVGETITILLNVTNEIAGVYNVSVFVESEDEPKVKNNITIMTTVHESGEEDDDGPSSTTSPSPSPTPTLTPTPTPTPSTPSPQNPSPSSPSSEITLIPPTALMPTVTPKQAQFPSQKPDDSDLSWVKDITSVGEAIVAIIASLLTIYISLKVYQRKQR